MEIREYAPSAQPAEPGATPTIFGSVSDGSDGTYTELVSWRESGTDVYHSDYLTCIFEPIDPTIFAPRFMHMMIRAKNPADFAANPNVSGFGQIDFYSEYRRADETTSTYPWDTWNINSTQAPTGQGSEFPAGLITDPTWYRFYYLGATGNKVIDPAVPPDSNHWRPADYDTEFYAWDALTGPGLRFDMFGLQGSTSEPAHAWLDIYEVRLVVAGDVVGATHAPPLRQYPRNDGLAGSARRLYPPPRSRQRSNRRAGGYL